MPCIPVRQLGFLQQGDIGCLGPSPCHDAFYIADIILEYLFQGNETLDLRASCLSFLDLGFATPQPFLRKGASGECLGLGVSQLSAFLEAYLSPERHDTFGNFSLGDRPIAAP